MRLNQIAFVTLVVAPLTAVGAQTSPAALGARRFGFAAGLNSSTTGGGDIGEPSRRIGPIAGVLLVAPITDMVAIEPQVLFTAKGADFSDSEGGGSFKMSYVQIPVLLRVEAAGSGSMRPFAFGGPALALKASCELEGVEAGINTSVSCDELEPEGVKFKSIDYSVVVGAGVAFDVAGRTMSIGARYDHSLGEVLDNSKVKHRVISVVATFEFPWAK